MEIPACDLDVYERNGYDRAGGHPAAETLVRWRPGRTQLCLEFGVGCQEEEDKEGFQFTVGCSLEDDWAQSQEVREGDWNLTEAGSVFPTVDYAIGLNT